MSIHLEPLTAVLRIGDDLEKFGDPYEFSATVVLRGSRAEIVSSAGKFDPKWHEDVDRALLSWGVTKLVFDPR